MTYDATGLLHEADRRMTILDFIILCATADPDFLVEEIRPGVWEAACDGRRFRSGSARGALERLAAAQGHILYEDVNEITALCEGLAPALCTV